MSAAVSSLESNRYLTVAACAAYIDRTPEAVRMLVKRRQIPHKRIAGRVQFDREQIDRWFERGRRN